MKTTARTFLAGALTAVCVPLAHAHPGHEGHDLTWDFQAGLAHPFTGLDHLLAMVAIGWWAVRLGGRARWLVPATFLAVLAVSAAFGHGEMRLGGLEQGIAASVVALGLMLAAVNRIPAAAAAVLAGTFAVFHGLAHGVEAPVNGAAGYECGFLIATALLLGLGQMAGRLSLRAPTRITRTAGIACAILGVALLFR